MRSFFGLLLTLFLVTLFISFGFQNCAPKGFNVSLLDGSISTKNYIDLVEKWPETSKIITENPKIEKTLRSNSETPLASDSSGKEPINFGFHMGGISPQGTPLIEESLFSHLPRSSWYITQWKKIHPLRPSVDLITNSSDKYLFKVEKPQNSESSLRAFSQADGKVIYEMTARQGYLTSIGGSNIFISTEVKDKSKSYLNREIIFSFNTKLLKKNASVRSAYKNESESLLKGPVSGFYLGGFPVSYNDGNPQNTASLFIQFYLADTRVNTFSDSSKLRFRSFYPHQNYLEIVAGLPINDITGRSSDMMISADNSQASLKNIRLNVNKLLCTALKEEFTNSEGKKINFATEKNGLYLKNLSAWSVTAVYMGFETQAVFFNESQDSTKYFYPQNHALYGAHDVRQDIKDQMSQNELYKGDVEIAAQISDLSLTAEAEPFSPLKSCDDVEKMKDSENLSPQKETVKCTASNTSKDCSQGDNSSKSPEYIKPVCAFGANISSTSKQAFEWKCDCDASEPISNKPGWQPVGGSCYHRIADSFCSGNQKVYYVCSQKQPPQGDHWIQQADTCYHWASGTPCK